jgi:hypothetical protein
MSSHAPPVPPANRSDKGPGSATPAPKATGPKGGEGGNPDKTGQSGNAKVNTTHQGHQQDR